jgi:hypothetical protein
MDEYIFIILLDVPAELEANFNTIYDTDHMPHMVQIPGVRGCTRYKLEWSDNADMPAYLALYNINDPELPRSAAWKKHASRGRWATQMRPHMTARRNGVFRLICRIESTLPWNKAKPANAGEYIYFLQQSVPAELESKFNRLYDNDHIPYMLQTPGVRGCTRFRLLYSESGDAPDYLAIYEIDAPGLPRSPKWKRQTNLGAWPTEMRPHFTARRNGVFHRFAQASA